MRILKECQAINPNIKFLLENVVMAKNIEKQISVALGCEPIKINSALVSAQNRNRLYWCNWQTCQPEDRGILLESILESGHVDRKKAYCIDANYHKGTPLSSYISKRRRQIVFASNTIKGFRKMSPVEVERLQTLPDRYTEGVSNTQRYKCLGNAWTVDVVAHLLQQSKNTSTTCFRKT